MNALTLTLATAFFLISGTAAVLADMSDARNFYQFEESVLTSGQPNATQLAEASNDGIEIVINLVPESERIYNPKEGSILAKQGIEYIHAPVNWKAPKKEEFRRFMEAMGKVGDRKVLVHCWGNVRASALVTAYRAIQAPDTQATELDRLEDIWRDVAGADLSRNTTWQKFLAQSLDSAR